MCTYRFASKENKMGYGSESMYFSRIAFNDSRISASISLFKQTEIKLITFIA